LGLSCLVERMQVIKSQVDVNGERESVGGRIEAGGWQKVLYTGDEEN
jgi:hypothetical protein